MKGINFEIYAEQEDGTLINDAVYRRNVAVEDKYNFRIKQTRKKLKRRCRNSSTLSIEKNVM